MGSHTKIPALADRSKGPHNSCNITAASAVYREFSIYFRIFRISGFFVGFCLIFGVFSVRHWSKTANQGQGSIFPKFQPVLSRLDPFQPISSKYPHLLFSETRFFPKLGPPNNIFSIQMPDFFEYMGT